MMKIWLFETPVIFLVGGWLYLRSTNTQMGTPWIYRVNHIMYVMEVLVIIWRGKIVFISVSWVWLSVAISKSWNSWHLSMFGGLRVSIWPRMVSNKHDCQNKSSSQVKQRFLERTPLTLDSWGLVPKWSCGSHPLCSMRCGGKCIWLEFGL